MISQRASHSAKNGQRYLLTNRDTIVMTKTIISSKLLQFSQFLYPVKDFFIYHMRIVSLHKETP